MGQHIQPFLKHADFFEKGSLAEASGHDPKLISTVNPRISPLGAHLFLCFLGVGLFEGWGLLTI